MGIFRLERWLAGAAAIAILAASAPASYAAPDTPEAIEAAVPVPVPADVPPPSAADVGAPAAQTANPAPAAAPSAKPFEEPPKNVLAPAPAETPKAAAAPAATSTPADIVASKIKDLLSAKSDRIFTSRKDRAGAEAFYAARNHAPVFVTEAGATDRSKAVTTYLASVDAEGLDPAEYPVPYVKAGMDADALAEAELRFAAAALTFARHAQIGRVHFSRVSYDIQYTLEAPEPEAVLAKVSTENVAEALASYNPPHPEYKALKAKLAEARNKNGAEAKRVPGGQTLRFDAKKPPMQDARVPQLREKLGVAAIDGDENYDKTLADAVSAFQKKKGMKPTGQLNTATVDALNGPKRDRDADIIIANMERWRWIARDLGKNRVVLNIPEFALRVYSDRTLVWQTRVVVGKPTQATPIMSETMKYITVNPTWNVPPSIVYNEYLPALQQDPTILARMGLRVTQTRDGGLHVSQPPGEKNALGRVRFNFPNKFLVYQHDTPDKHLFANDKRAFSHGCMRVQDPAKYAEVILGLANPGSGYTQDRIKSMYGNSEIDIKLVNHIPVHLTYQTAFVDDAGNLQIREDVYGRDARLIAILKGDERKVAEAVMDRPQQSYARPPVNLPYGAVTNNSGFGNNTNYNGGGNFFDLLFGPPRPAAPPPRAQSRRTAQSQR